MDWTIGEISRLSGVSIETVRYWEREGLVPRPPRTTSGRRVYAPSDLKTLKFIRNSRDLGFSLEAIRDLLALRGPDNSCADVKAIAQKHLEHVRTQMARITKVESVLADAVARCPGGKTVDCTLLEILEA
ncbi:MerR family transcriptional regulator [Rhodoplanes sp. Z2-YC6860]|uniref:MerR family transcriptional regulator n=1 Tax=Rhodoplanes sp. Z2-YC6860 TaxID=674703 RepID=UPI00078E63C7|nr:helix-turn-helix domain-containing protein [Rhodoplanes sp. Z2-YC6860]AMN40473.1 transcriptional regulator, MerR family [Rhodoplanes sp. Z2-YC6860]